MHIQRDKGEDTVKFTKSLRLRWYGHVKLIQNQRTSKGIATITTEGTSKIGRPRKIRRGSRFVEVLRYKPESHGFDSRLGNW
jgi:hypothetical protein